MSDEPGVPMPACFAMIFFFAILAAITGASINDGYWKRESVAKGHARFSVDNQGNVKWEWKEITVDIQAGTVTLRP